MTTIQEFYQYYITLPDHELSKRLDLIRSQMTIAFEKRNDQAMQNLQNAENALIQARLFIDK